MRWSGVRWVRKPQATSSVRKKQGDLSVVTNIHTSSGPGRGGSGIVSILMSYLP